jgi:hypothetical protein
MNDRAVLWARASLVWLLVGMAAGVQIGMAGEFGASSHHAHAGLIGGVWSMFFAFLFDRKGSPSTVAAKVQWAIYNLAVVAMTVCLYVVARHGGIWGLGAGVSGLVLLGTTAWIAVSAWPQRRQSS